MENLFQDMRHGARSLLATPSLTALSLLSLGLAIGLVTAVFSLAYPVLFRPLPFRDADRLVVLSEKNESRGYNWFPVAPVNFEHFLAETEIFESVVAVENWTATVTSEARADRLSGLKLSPNFFEFLGISAQLGRTLQASDGAPSAAPVVVISDRLWRERYGGDRAVIGTPITVDGVIRAIIGVLPPDFHFLQGDYRLWSPLPPARDPRQRARRTLGVWARLSPAVSANQATARLETLMARLATDHPETHAGWSATVSPVQRFFVEQSNVLSDVMMLGAAAALVLLMACINVANLQLARAATREKELALRAALGAGRARIIRQLLTESAVMALAAGAIGVGFTYVSLDLLRLVLPEIMFFPPESVGVHLPLLVFAVGVSLATALLFGTVPALRASGLRLNDSLREGGRSGRSGFRTRRSHSALIIAETALAAVVLLGAALLLNSYLRLKSLDPGFNPDNVLTLRVRLAKPKHNQDSDYVAFFREGMRRLQSVPGVVSVAAVDILPLERFAGWFMEFKLEGRPEPAPGEWPNAVYRTASPELFAVLGIPLLEGRPFRESDDESAPGVVIIDRVMAEQFWPTGGALGARVHLSAKEKESNWLEVVGVVEDVEEWAFGTQVFGRPAQPMAVIYRPMAQAAMDAMQIVIKSSVPPGSLAAEAQRQIWSIDPDQPITGVRGLRDHTDQALEAPLTQLRTAAIFAALALALAISGIHGVMAFSASRRMHEMGIRLTLGAQRGDVLKLVLGEAARLALIGVGLGLLISIAFTKVLAGTFNLFHVRPSDPLSLAAVTALLILVAVLSSLAPALRATRADPLDTLRSQ